MSKLKKALEKAKKEFPKAPAAGREQRNLVLSPSRFQKRSELKVDIHQTKIESIPPSKLEEGKIFALFQKYKANKQIKTLRTQVLKKLEAMGGNTLIVTSANPGEGKTFTSINLGVSIAQELDRTILLVDADLKNPAKHHFDFARDFFSLQVHKGLADVLMGRARLQEVLLNPGIEKLTILPGGSYLDNSSELMGSPRMEQVVEDIKKRYKDRIVIFDTPAMLASADTVQLAKFVDSVLFVVEEEKTSADEIKQATNLLSDVQIIGMILNKSKSE